jgi:hypothetical protein
MGGKRRFLRAYYFNLHVKRHCYHETTRFNT